MFFVRNVRGLNGRNKRFWLRKWILDNKLLVGGLLETHIKKDNEHRIKAALPADWYYHCNHDADISGRIWIVWHPSVKVIVYESNIQTLTCGIEIPLHEIRFTATLVYGKNSAHERSSLWQNLKNLADYPPLGQSPWLVVGDFNQPLFPTERSDFLNNNIPSQGMEAMEEAISHAGLSDIESRGLLFTWFNNQSANPLAVKLDRAMGNAPWHIEFQEVYVEFKEPGMSDHAACQFFFPSPIRQVIKNNWMGSSVPGTMQYRLCRSLKGLKQPLRQLNAEQFSNISLRTKQEHLKLKGIQHQLYSAPNEQLVEAEKLQRKKWVELANAEEIFFMQKSRIRWLQAGDRNTTFFHKVAKARVAKNHIHYLIDQQGNRIDQPEEIKNHAVEYFQDLIGKPDETVSVTAESGIVELFNLEGNLSTNTLCTSIPTAEEIKSTLLAMPNKKAPGPDGFGKE
ncbi:PREDICTED: uncharacterized protein LOC104807977, partial [Tarenaya hassleriana]|uniref:uncharacterized protein LOC104807977 n=1 Tax=Tarenaya hassleriana TaxID=28532 RepID=UPI00053C6263